MNPIDCYRGRDGTSRWDSLFESVIKMKYTIEGFSQEAALSIQTTITENGNTKTIKLDIVDLTILRWIVDFYPRMKKTIIDGDEYVWFDYATFVEDMPLLGLSKQSLYKRCIKMSQLGILKHKTIRSNGTYSYYGFGPEYSRLISTPSRAAQAPTAAQDPWACYTTPNSTQTTEPEYEPQPLLDEPQAPAQPKKPDPTEEVVNHLNHRLGTQYKPTTQATRKLIKARIKEGFTVEDMKLVIDKKAAEWSNNPKMAQFLRPDILFGNKFEGYLNARSCQQTRQNNTAYRQNIDPAAAAYLEANAQYLTSDKGWF